MGNRLINLLPETALHEISAVTLRGNETEDKFNWGVSGSGEFSLASAYEKIANIHNQSGEHLFKIVWRWKGPERIKLLLWKIGNCVLMTNMERKRRHLTDISLCPICGVEEESLFHVFRDCPRIALVWKTLLPTSLRGFFFRCRDWNQWLCRNLIGTRVTGENLESAILFGVCLDVIWQARNNYVFHDKMLTPRQLAYQSMQQKEAVMNATINSIGTINSSWSPTSISSHVWTPPPQGRLKLNCDAAVLGEDNKAGCGGIIRSNTGICIIAYSQKLDFCTVLEAELWAIYHGLCVAWSRGFSAILVESDSSQAISLLEVEVNPQHGLFPLLSGIKEIGEGQIDIQWKHVNREANLAADWLAKDSIHSSENFILYDNDLPDDLFSIILADARSSVSL